MTTTYGPSAAVTAPAQMISVSAKVNSHTWNDAQVAKPWLDTKGRLRLQLDIRNEGYYSRKKGACVEVRVKHHGLSTTFKHYDTWPIHKTIPLDTVPQDKDERQQLLLNIAELTALQLGHPFRLRSKKF